MPETPELAFQRTYIENHIQNKLLTKLNILWGRYKNHGPPDNYHKFKRHLPLRCINVQKKGKVLFIYFENNWCVISKLGMSGWWYCIGDEPKWKPVTKNIVFEFDRNKELIFSDFRNFGTLTFTQDDKVIQQEINKLAPDILQDSTTFRQVISRIHNLSTKSKERLLEDILVDQKQIVSGIGNYLKSEVLYDARISPLRKVKDVSMTDWMKIFKSTKKICKMMYKVLLKQDVALYMGSMKVYHKEKDPLGNTVKQHLTKAGRMTFWVPTLQS